MFGKTEERMDATTETITPPLMLAWDYDVSGGIGNGSPLIIDSVLLVGNMRGELHAVNSYTGKRIGWVDLGDAIESSPTLDGNIAFVSLSNTRLSLVAFDLLEGKAAWKVPLGDIEASPLIFHRRIYVGNTSGALFCVQPSTGETLWKFELPKNNTHEGIRSAVAASDSSVVVGADDGVLYCLNAETGGLKWKYDSKGPIVSTPCIADGRVYIGNLNGTLSAVGMDSGALQWKHETHSGIYASASFAADKVFIGTTAGEMYAFDALNGSVVWKTSLGSVVNSGGLVAGNILYVGTLKKTLFGLDISDGKVVARQEVDGRIKTSPAIAHGMLFVATDDRLILAFKSSVP
jgi:outer membrane protein assembly factor BamB